MDQENTDQRPGLSVLGPVGLAGPIVGRLARPRVQALLGHLVARANRPVPVADLVAGLWPEGPPVTATTTLRGYVRDLRRALDGSAASVGATPGGYELRVSRSAVDALRFDDLVADAQVARAAGRVGDALGLLGAALVLWRGEPYEGLAPVGAVGAEVARLLRARRSAETAQIAALLTMGEGAALVPRIEALVAAEPTSEALVGLLIRALHAAGRRADAVAAYDAIADRLDAAGLEPGVALVKLHDRVRADAGVAMLPAPVRRRGNLPAETTSLVGRRRELDAVLAGLERSRLVTISGAGGIGKTRLAVAAAPAAAAADEERLFVDLAPVEPSTEVVAEVVAAVAAALGGRGPGDPFDALVRLLGGRDVLLVVDNCEHVVEAAAGLVHRLLAALPGLRVLATSREVLGGPAEVVVDLGPLPVPAPEAASMAEVLASEAGRLFVERATAATGRFVLGEDNAPAVAAACRSLDGVPLAIELAAPWLRSRTPEQLAADLASGDRLIVAGARRLTEPRHRTLWTTVEWSYRLLSQAEQQLLVRISVFAGAFAPVDVERLSIAEDAPVRDLLDGLVSKSLVVRTDDDPCSYRLLVPVRSCLRLLLRENGAWSEARHWHAMTFLRLAEAVAADLLGPCALRAHQQLDERRDDLRFALSWFVEQRDGTSAARMARALWQHWDRRYDITYGREALTAVLALEMSAELRADLLVGAAHLAYVDDDLDVALELCERGLAMAADLGDRVVRARFLTTAAEARRHLNPQAAEAKRLCREGVALLADGHDPWSEADAHRVLALLALDEGSVEVARRAAERCSLLWEECGDAERSAGAQLLLATVALDSGDLDGARRLAESSVAGFRHVGELGGVAHALWRLGEIELLGGCFEHAGACGEESLALARRLGIMRVVGAASAIVAQVALHAGEQDRAAELADEGFEILRRRGFVGDLAMVQHVRALVARDRGDVPTAARLCEETLAACRARGVQRWDRQLTALLDSLVPA